MYGRKCLLTLALTVLAVSVFPGTSSAQLFGRGRGYGGGGYGGGYYGGGYGGGMYGPGYYSPGYGGLSVGVGRGYGYGYPYGGGYGLGYGGVYGSPYSSYGYTTGSYYSSPGVAYSQPSNYVDGTTSYHSMYMPQGVDTGCGCGCVGGTASGTTTVAAGGRGTIMVNVPANAVVTWNGSRSAAYGPVRYYTTLPIDNNGNTTQKFEARWTGSDGQTITRTREIQARPNETVTIDFNSETDSATNGASQTGTPQTHGTPVNRPNGATGTNGASTGSNGATTGSTGATGSNGDRRDAP